MNNIITSNSIFMMLKMQHFLFYSVSLHISLAFPLIKFVRREHTHTCTLKKRKKNPKYCFAFLHNIFLTVDFSWRSCTKRASFVRYDFWRKKYNANNNIIKRIFIQTLAHLRTHTYSKPDERTHFSHINNKFCLVKRCEKKV